MLINMSGLDSVCETTNTKITEARDIVHFMGEVKNNRQECFYVITLNTKNKIIQKYMVTMGLLDSAPVHPREIFYPAIKDGASAIIVVHNHPSGDSTPSAQDIKLTKDLLKASKVMQIPVLDHIIITPSDQWTSLRDQGLCVFDC
jgi:DNA repair protein RadC